MGAAILDTGPLVAFFVEGERYHRWSMDRIEELDQPLLACEPVVTEAMYLLGRFPAAQDVLFVLLENGAIKIGFHVGEHVAALRTLHRKYRDIPMSLADACIVRMSEIHDRHAVLTLDSDFTVYRKRGRVPLPLIYPGA